MRDVNAPAAWLVPTFRSSYAISAITLCELRKAMGTSKFLILVPLFDLKSLGPFRREQRRDFKSAALAHAFRAISPPSTGMTAPVRKEAAGRHRLNVMCATSSGSPYRPSAVRRLA